MAEGFALARSRPLLCLALAALLVASLCAAFEPRWDTNDDPGMAMAAHGYGLAAQATPNLIYTNVLWGHLAQAMPEIRGVPGYSLLTMAVLVVVAWVLLHSALRLGVERAAAVLAVLLLMIRPVLFPQFTINAGLLTVAALAALWSCERDDDGRALAAAVLLAFCGFLVRWEEFVLIALVALPLLPWRALRERRRFQAAAIGLAALISVASVVDGRAYDGPEWRRYLELDEVRAKYIDFGAAHRLKERPELLARHGYSTNDVELFRRWFLVDPAIADPRTLQAMLDESQDSLARGGTEAGLRGLRTLSNTVVLPLVIAGALLLFLRFSPRVALSWALCLAALFALGFLGRPGVLRVYIPVLSLMVIAPLLSRPVDGLRKQATIAVLAGAALLNAYWVFPQATQAGRAVERVGRDLGKLPVQTIAVWSDAFPYEEAYPVLADTRNLRSLRIYGLDAWTYAPFTVAYAEQRSGRGFVERLRRDGVELVASRAWLPMLDTYCRQRIGARLQASPLAGPDSFELHRVRCAP